MTEDEKCAASGATADSEQAMTEPTDRDREMYLDACRRGQEDIRLRGVDPLHHLGDYEGPHIIAAIAAAREEGRREERERQAKAIWERFGRAIFNPPQSKKDAP